MTYNSKSKEYRYEYEKKFLKRVPLDMTISDYEAVKTSANSVGESINGYIKRAIKQRMERDAANMAEHDLQCKRYMTINHATGERTIRTRTTETSELKRVTAEELFSDGNSGSNQIELEVHETPSKPHQIELEVHEAPSEPYQIELEVHEKS